MLQTSLYHQLRKRRDKLNSDGAKKSRKSDDNAVGDMTPAKAKLSLFDKWTQGIRDPKQFKDLMGSVRPLLKADAKKSPGLVLYTHYPYLTLKELVSIP